MITAAIWFMAAAIFCLDCSTVHAQDKRSPLYWLVAPLTVIAAALATAGLNS